MTGTARTRRWRATVLAIAGAVCACGPAPRAHHRIAIAGLAFPPLDASVQPGDTLTWINTDIVPHTVTASDGSWDSGEVPPGAEWSLVVAEGTERRYVCLYHPTMTGSVLVR